MSRRTAGLGGEVEVMTADVPRALYDEWRRVIVFPYGLTLIEQGETMCELFAEHRGEVSQKFARRRGEVPR